MSVPIEFFGRTFRAGQITYEEYKQNQILAAEGWEISLEEERAETLTIERIFGPEKRGSRVLDIGFGFGRSLRKLSSMGFDVVGIDINEKKVDMMKEEFDVYCADAANLPFEDESFDFVYSSHSFEHMLDPSMAMIEFVRVLKPSGKIFIIIPYPDRGPDYIHCATLPLGLYREDNGEFTKNWFSQFAEVESFNVFGVSDEHRQSEIELILRVS